MKQTLLLVAAVALLATPVLAFHDGGVAECGGCHTMHNAASANFLLNGTDQSSVCLSCHESIGDTGPTRYHISTPAGELTAQTDIPKQYTPGGDFGWLRQNFTATATYYATITNNGWERGHNIVAADNFYAADPGNTTAPGGTMLSTALGCHSCHDPHGQARIDDTGAVLYPAIGTTFPPITESGSYGHVPGPGEAVGTYRILGGPQYQASGTPVPFPGVVPAVVPSTYNRVESATPTRVAYGKGTGDYASITEWCGACHPQMHDSQGGFDHVVDSVAMSSTVRGNYNAYVKTGDLTNNPADSFTSLVPFANNTTDIATLDSLADITGTLNAGPATDESVTCLTCHRAHAGAWKYAMRWNQEAEFLTLGTPALPVYPGVDAGLGNQGQFNRGYTIAQMQAGYYDRAAGQEFAGHQRVLCNKCHLKD